MAYDELSIDSPITDSTIIADQIIVDISSESKCHMYEGIRYFRNMNDIICRKQYYTLDGVLFEDKTKANNKLIHPFFRTMIIQKTAYIVGQPVVFSTDEDKYSQAITELLGESFDDIANKWVSGASVKGVEWLHPYINKDGDFKFTVIPSEQVIPIYDSHYEDELLSVIRYYHIDRVINKDKVIQRYKVEFWDNQKVTYYIQDDEKDDIYHLDMTEQLNPRFHWYTYNTLNPTQTNANAWGRVPFIALENNDECMSDLRLSKSLIDDYDLSTSDMSNNLKEIQELIWVLKGYEGEDLDEFMRNLKAFKAITLSENGDADAKSADIPNAARDSHLNRLEDDIYLAGMAVNMKTDKFGNSPSGVALKFMYSLLDLSSNILIRKLKSSLREFTWFATQYINMKNKTKYDYKSIKFVINKTMISNEAEKIKGAQESKGIISDETIIENHPWVDNLQAELKRIEEQKASYPPVNLNGGGV